VIDTAIKMMTKEESDPSVLMAEKQEMITRLNEMKINRDNGAASKINDVSRTMPWEFWSFGNMS